MTHSASALMALASLLAATSATAQTAYPATLSGHAVLAARSFIEAPADAPESLRTSGKYTAPGGRRVDALASLPGTSFLSDPAAPRPTGISLPFASQPVQGFSGIKSLGQGRFAVLSDNGYGSRANSPDAMLMFHEVQTDWARGQVRRTSTVFLRDPDRKLPFLIVNEGTRERYLTGADLDIESMQFIGDDVWFGDELGPYLVKTDRSGKVLAVFETLVDGQPVRSPDHYAVATPAKPGAFVTRARRSRGYEGMAASPDGRYLYPLLEGPLWDDKAKAWESRDGREYLRILEFDVRQQAWTGRSWKYALHANGNNIGDFNMIDADTGLIIERDNGEGRPADACSGPPRPDCQNAPARFKRVVKVSLKDADADGFVRKIGDIDLMAINDPKGVGGAATQGGQFAFPFVTIEDVDVVDAEHIVVANDNNLPYSAGRRLGHNDDNEFILLHVPELLKAR